MKLFSALLFLLLLNTAHSQDYTEYFKGEKLNCGTANSEALDYLARGINILHLNFERKPEYYEKCAELFHAAIKKDSTFCDAYFFTGYALSLTGNKDAVVFYYMADSLSFNKSILFKLNLAAAALKMGPQGADLARKKYEEIIQYFPYSHQGHYGYAITSTIIGDYDKGLQQLDIAVDKYKKQYKKEPEDAVLLRGALLSLNNKHEEAIALFKKEVSNELKKEDNYKVHYAYSLYKLSEIKQDKKMREKAFLLYNTVKDKASVPDTLDIRKLAITKPVTVQE
jgi:tetratricopeptide (TPR) repeat protein